MAAAAFLCLSSDAMTVAAGQIVPKGQRQAMLEGDEVVEPNGDFLANRYSDAMCGGVMVNPRVYLTAAHCVENDPNIKIGAISAYCTRDGNYAGSGQAHDVAACLLNAPGIVGITYETLDVVQGSLAVNDEVLLTGYGGSSTRPIGVDLVGPTMVTRIANGVVVTDGRTWIRKSGGDSGSTAYSVKNGRRRIIAVNSAAGGGPKESILSSVKPSQGFLSSWSQSNGVVMCGLDGHMGPQCRP